MTEKQLRGEIRARANEIGVALLGLVVKAADAFGREVYKSQAVITGPGILDLAMNMADEHYQLPEGELDLAEEAVRFFELGMSKLIDQCKEEGLSLL